MNAFDLTGRVAIVTGGAGLLGIQHAEALAWAGAHVVLADIDGTRAHDEAQKLAARFGSMALGVPTDVTNPESVQSLREFTVGKFGRIDILVNNAALDPKVGAQGLAQSSRFEHFSLEQWDREIRVGLTGAFLCAQAIGSYMAAHGGGVIVNIASDLSVIAPDQRIYQQPQLNPASQPVKPVTYSVMKTALIGLTRYLATYWAARNVRVNALSPGGIFDGQAEDFVAKLVNLIPMGRMAQRNEYQGAVLFLCSDASSYMTGQNLVMDGGRSVW